MLKGVRVNETLAWYFEGKSHTLKVQALHHQQSTVNLTVLQRSRKQRRKLTLRACCTCTYLHDRRREWQSRHIADASSQAPYPPQADTIVVIESSKRTPVYSKDTVSDMFSLRPRFVHVRQH